MEPTDELVERLNRRRQSMGDSLLSAPKAKWYKGPPPAAPSYPELVSAMDTTLKLRWDAPPLPPAPEPESKAPGAPKPKAPKAFLYKVEFGYKYGITSGWEIAYNNLRAPKCTLQGLEPNTTYVARVYAKYVEGGEWGAPSSSSWGMATLTAAAAAEIRAKRAVAHEKEVEASARQASETRRSKAEQAAHEAKQRAAALEASLLSTKSEAEKERLLRKKLQEERDQLDKETARRRAEAAALQERLARVTQQQQEFAEKAAAATDAERKRAAEAQAYKAAADAAAAARAEEARGVQVAMRKLQAEWQAKEEEHRRRLAEGAQKSTEEQERVKAERAAQVAALKAHQDELEAQLTQLESDKVEAARLAEARAKEEAARLAEAHAKLKAESDEMVAAQHKQVAALKEQLARLRIEQQATRDSASSKIEEEAARKEEAEELVRFQIEQAEQAAASTNAQVSALQQQVARFEQMMLTAKQAADASAKTAEACTRTIMLQAEENEYLRRKARYQEATIRSLQGAGPNPELESELVGAGHARENVRFFMEVHGWEDKKKLVALLNELKTLRGDGTYPDDAIREALTVCTDKSKVEGYLAEYIANHHGRYGVGHAASEEDGV